MATTENLTDKLFAQVLLKEEKLEFNLREVLDRSEFMKLLKENLSKKESEGEKQ